MHFGYGPQGKLHIIRKPGERYCQDRIQETDQPADKHCWAAVGHNLKIRNLFLDQYFYGHNISHCPNSPDGKTLGTLEIPERMSISTRY